MNAAAPKDIPRDIEHTALKKMTVGRWLPTGTLIPGETPSPSRGCSGRGWINFQNGRNGAS